MIIADAHSVYPSYNLDPNIDPRNAESVLLVSYCVRRTSFCNICTLTDNSGPRMPLAWVL